MMLADVLRGAVVRNNMPMKWCEWVWPPNHLLDRLCSLTSLSPSQSPSQSSSGHFSWRRSSSISSDHNGFNDSASQTVSRSQMSYWLNTSLKAQRFCPVPKKGGWFVSPHPNAGLMSRSLAAICAENWSIKPGRDEDAAHTSVRSDLPRHSVLPRSFHPRSDISFNAFFSWLADHLRWLSGFQSGSGLFTSTLICVSLFPSRPSRPFSKWPVKRQLHCLETAHGHLTSGNPAGTSTQDHKNLQVWKLFWYFKYNLLGNVENIPTWM